MSEWINNKKKYLIYINKNLMKFPIKFFYPQHLVLLVIMGLCFGFRKVIEILYFKESMPLFLMFLGESLSIIVYLY